DVDIADGRILVEDQIVPAGVDGRFRIGIRCRPPVVQGAFVHQQLELRPGHQPGFLNKVLHPAVHAYVDLRLVPAATLGGDQYHPVGSPGTVNGGGRSVFEDIYGFNVGGVDVGYGV